MAATFRTTLLLQRRRIIYNKGVLVNYIRNRRRSVNAFQHTVMASSTYTRAVRPSGVLGASLPLLAQEDP
eukprot:6625132-Pyramimonas_sp.AAC.2